MKIYKVLKKCHLGHLHLIKDYKSYLNAKSYVDWMERYDDILSSKDKNHQRNEFIIKEVNKDE